jgi:hypothetical protein
MAVFTGNGYLVADLEALKTIPAIERPAFKVALLVAGLGWHEYDNAATSGGIVPNDNPTAGRWFPLATEKLRANRTYFVRTDGSDSNTGLANPRGGAFLTPNKAVAVASVLDFNGFSVTIQLGDGTYSLGSSPLILPSISNGAKITIQGNTSNAASVTLTSTAALGTIQAYDAIGGYFLRWLTVTNTSNGHGIYNSNSIIGYERLVFGSVGTGYHVVNADGARTGNSFNGVYYPYTISGGATGHAYNTGSGSIFTCAVSTITVSGTPAFSNTFCLTENNAYSNFFSPIFSGSATGKRYDVTSSAVINTFGGGATFLPGNVSGTVATGGQYL